MKSVKGDMLRYGLFIALSMLAATGSMTVAYMINRVINGLIGGQPIPREWYLYYFPGGLLLFFICRWTVSFNVISYTQMLLNKTRMEILDMVIRASWFSLLKNKEKVYNGMTKDAANIVQASISIVDIVTNAIIAVICFVYMGILAWQLLLSLFGLIGFTVLIYGFGIRKQRTLFGKAMYHDDKVVRYVGEILEGFKEIVVDRNKGVAIKQQQIEPAAVQAMNFNRKALLSNLNNRVTGQIGFYIFIGLVIFYLGAIFHIESKVLINFIFLVLYIFGPIETVVVLIPALAQANASFKRLSFLTEDLRIEESHDPEEQGGGIPPDFHRLDARDLSYTYIEGNETLFRVGPLDFQCRRGEIVFIFGGNGSGKTTFINLLTGLFPDGQGTILLNGKVIANTQCAAYKGLFAPVFSDFHLFDACYGIAEVDAGKAQQYLHLFELESKVHFSDGKFSTINLSAGQRKRLALICALLEKKPVLVLDEFAADQDPYFRKKFYLEILETIRSEGFTIIAVTHDDNFYNCCDFLYKMDAGGMQLVRHNHLSNVH